MKVYFNNSCKICKAEIDLYKKEKIEEIDWVDITNNDLAKKETNKDNKELLRRLHVKEGEKVTQGAAAFLLLWKKMPKYKFLYNFFKLPIIFNLFHYGYEMVAFFLYMDSNTDQHGMPFRKGGERAIRHHKYWCRAANSFQAHQISHSICSLICTFVFYPEVLSASCHSYQSFVRAFIHVAPFLLISLEVFLSRIPIRVSYIFLIAIWYYIAAINVGFINVLRTSTNVLSNLSFDHFNHYI